MTNFRELNAGLPAALVLEALGLQCSNYNRDRWRGRCPYHESTKPRSRSLAVSLSLRKFCCHRCGMHGDLIDLWAHVQGVSLAGAAKELEERFL